jgi:hypothetical protein
MGYEMHTDDRNRHASPRRETATRGAFYIWSAAYATALIAIVTAYGLGGSLHPMPSKDHPAARSGTLANPPPAAILRANANG